MRPAVRTLKQQTSIVALLVSLRDDIERTIARESEGVYEDTVRRLFRNSAVGALSDSPAGDHAHLKDVAWQALTRAYGPAHESSSYRWYDRDRLLQAVDVAREAIWNA